MMSQEKVKTAEEEKMLPPDNWEWNSGQRK